MLGLLVRYHGDGLLFPDLLAYVLELLLSVSRMINEESKGRRTATFTDWWASEPLADRKNIERLRHAELKQGKRLSAQRYKTVASAQPADFSDLLVNAGDSVSTMTWFWQDGPFSQEQVMATVQTYLARSACSATDETKGLAACSSCGGSSRGVVNTGYRCPEHVPDADVRPLQFCRPTSLVVERTLPGVARVALTLGRLSRLLCHCGVSCRCYGADFSYGRWWILGMRGCRRPSRTWSGRWTR